MGFWEPRQEPAGSQSQQRGEDGESRDACGELGEMIGGLRQFRFYGKDW